MSITQPPIICLMGPTAVGKSQLAIDLTEVLPCDIISVDSVMVYRGMDIGTAKPDKQTLLRTPHRLVNIREPYEPYSAGDFFRDVQKEIEISVKNNRIPLLVGGTMLYFNTLRQGLADLPSYSDHPNYLDLKAELDSLDASTLHHQLEKHDPLAAKRLHINDRQRVQRALLVYHLSKRSLSTLHAHNQRQLPYSMLWLAVYPESREALKKKIAMRFDAMLAQGLIEEVQSLYAQPGFSRELPAYRAVGYRQVIDYLEGDISKDELSMRGIAATSQLAKRQFTWLRSWPNLMRLEANNPNLIEQTKQAIEKEL